MSLEFDAVSVWIPSGRLLLENIDWQVSPGDTWAVLGPNGAGKTTLLSMASLARFPSSGTVSVLGNKLGTVDIWTLKSHIGVVDPSMRMPTDLLVEDIVITGRTGSIQPMWNAYTSADQNRARELLKLVGCSGLIGRTPAGLSHGERGRVRIARALMADPKILLLDEPATGLDLMAREELLQTIEFLRTHTPQTAIIIVSHHVEELPVSTTHALLLSGGKAVASGPVDLALTSASLSTCFGGNVDLQRSDGRWSARLRPEN